MEIEVKEFNRTVVAYLSGSLDQSAYDQANEIFQELSTRGKDIVVDLTGVKFLSSSGFRILFQTQKALVEKSRKLILVGLDERIRNSLDLIGLSSSFSILDTTTEALQAV